MKFNPRNMESYCDTVCQTYHNNDSVFVDDSENGRAEWNLEN